MTITTMAELPTLVGARLGTSRWFDVTDERVDQFHEATDDRVPIPEDVRDGFYGGRVAHGLMTLSLLGAMWADVLLVSDAGMVVNYGLNRVRFPAPVPVGSRLRLTATLQSCEEVGTGLQITAAAVIGREGSEKPVCVAEPVFRIFPP